MPLNDTLIKHLIINLLISKIFIEFMSLIKNSYILYFEVKSKMLTDISVSMISNKSYVAAKINV